MIQNSVKSYQNAADQHLVPVQNTVFFRQTETVAEVLVKLSGFYSVDKPGYLVITRYFFHFQDVFRVLPPIPLGLAKSR
jgi:hypothetical protein